MITNIDCNDEDYNDDKRHIGSYSDYGTDDESQLTESSANAWIIYSSI